MSDIKENEIKDIFQKVITIFLEYGITTPENFEDNFKKLIIDSIENAINECNFLKAEGDAAKNDFIQLFKGYAFPMLFQNNYISQEQKIKKALEEFGEKYFLENHI